MRKTPHYSTRSEHQANVENSARLQQLEQRFTKSKTSLNLMSLGPFQQLPDGRLLLTERKGQTVIFNPSKPTEDHSEEPSQSWPMVDKAA